MDTKGKMDMKMTILQRKNSHNKMRDTKSSWIAKKGIALALALLYTMVGCAYRAPENLDLPASSEQTLDTAGELSEADKFSEPDQKSCIIQEDDRFLYVCGTYRVEKIDKETGEMRILWENKKHDSISSANLYQAGNGILVQGRLYFIESWWEEEDDSWHKAFSVVDTQGENHQRIREISPHGNDTILLQDGIIFTVDSSETVCYQLSPGGTVKAIPAPVQPKIYLEMEGDYHEVGYYHNGYRRLFAQESVKQFGWCLLQENLEIAGFLDNGEEILEAGGIVDNRLRAYNDTYLLTVQFEGNGVYSYYLVDHGTLEQRFLMQCDSSWNIICMDEDNLYMESVQELQDGRFSLTCKAVSLDTGDIDVIFVKEDYTRDPEYCMNMVITGGYVYYVAEKDYMFYLARRSLADPSREELLGEAYYDSGIDQVGSLVFYRGGLYSEIDPEYMLVEFNFSWLQVDERFAGADKINRYLAEYHENIMDQGREDAGWLEEELHDQLEASKEEQEEYSWHMHYSYDSSVSEVSYFDERYMSFCQDGYDYWGGAHGMPYQVGFTFDLQTGQRLYLSDVIGNSEEELKEIVTAAFAEKINKNPEYYWDDALTIVSENTDMDIGFYLTESGIYFSFGPYLLASYAQGFQEVVIPYEKFRMKIPVTGSSQTVTL